MSQLIKLLESNFAKIIKISIKGVEDKVIKQ